MTNDERDLLTVLKKELQFLERGGYRDMPTVSWRPKFIFQDSPTCLNYDPTKPPKPCSDCALTQLVPGNMRANKLPCRHIPLNAKGETIDSFYRCGTRSDLEDSFGPWLRATIERLETGHGGDQLAFVPMEIHVKARANHAE